MNALFSVDVEPDLHNNTFKGVVDGMPRLSKMLAKYKVKATFFTTCDCMEKYPALFKNLIKEGHEIALHGYRHERFDNLSKKEKEDRINKSLGCFKKYLRSKPLGFRAPQHSIDEDTIAILSQKGFKYDSSRTPENLMLMRHLLRKKTSKKDVIKNLLSNFIPYDIYGKLLEIPRASFFISTGGFELKVYPKGYYKFLIPMYKFLKIPLVFVMHSWDMINIPQSRTSKLCSPKKFEARLDEFLSYTSKRLKYQRMIDFYNERKN
ncbi:MAG: polysaccharide deacetylase family protein [Nanoarchaeota archaeon]|nr:polysaccharide deacetylase family protein [Nanoarchaeota archaeon]